ncbi:site-specific integrase, partial [Candidatus Sumerlaeota bacterium]|nr:site-specific integrase [Candidatus Sumerlaeota bacterium]
TKTRRYRTIPIHPELKKIFLEIKKQVIDSPYVFVNPRTLRPVTDIRKRLKSACQRAGIKPCTLHQLRHTFATMLVAQGTPLPVVQQLLGHTDIRSTQIYLSIFEEQKRKAIESLQLFSGEEKN